MAGLCSRFLSVVACGLLVARAGVALAVVPSETLLPKTTKGYLSVANVDQLREEFNKTQLGQLMQDPVMQPFAADFKRQLQQKWSQSHEKIGLSWEDLEGVPGGEVAIAVIQPSKKEAALAMLVDATGHTNEANALLEKINQNMTAKQAKRTQQTIFGVNVTVYDIAKKGDKPAQQSAFFLKDDLLGAADNLKVLEGILGRLSAGAAGAKDSLATLAAFEAIMKRCQAAAGDLKPQARWFIEPFGYADVVRITNSDRHKRKGQDMLKVLRNQGFTAIQGVGGFVNFAVDRYEILHRTFVYAPPVKAGPEKYELAARMLKFPNGGKLTPQDWIPREIASFATLNVDTMNAFNYSKTLVNEIVGDEVFDDVLQSIQDDPNGPQINIRADLVAKLGNRATLFTDYNLPITPKSERMLIAIEATNPAVVAATIEKSMKTDPDAKRREFNGHVIWEIVNQDAQVPMVTIENTPAFAPLVQEEDKNDEEKKKGLPNSAVTVAHGHMLVATHVDFLIKVLTPISEREQLTQATDYQLVHAELTKLGATENCAITFSRTDEEYRAIYELIRTGRMPEAESMVGRMLNAMLGDGKEGMLRQQRIDGSKMPDFETIRRYFGPAGLVATSEKDGWLLVGMTLSKDTSIATAANATAQGETNVAK